MLALCLMLLVTYYALNYAGKISWWIYILLYYPPIFHSKLFSFPLIMLNPHHAQKLSILLSNNLYYFITSKIHGDYHTV